MKNYTPYLQWIDQQEGKILTVLEKWVNTNSGTGNVKGINAMISSLEEAFATLNGTMVRVSLPPKKRINSLGTIVEEAVGDALVISKRPEAPLQIILAGHMDTVYAPDSLFQKMEKINSELIRGPGVADMKGGLAIMLTALQAIERSPYADQIGWDVVINPEEEIGSPCSERLFIEKARNKQLGLVFEPAYMDGAIVSQRKGSFNFTVVSTGKAAHAGRDFHLGRNAITALAKFILKAEALNDLQRGITVNIGHIEGGKATNIVPDLAICRCNVRMVNPQDLTIIKEQLQSIVDEQNDNTGSALEFFEESERGPKPFDAQHEKLFESLKECADELDISLTWKPSGGVCDGNIIAAEGIPTVDTLGAVGENIHTFDECARIDSLTSRAKLTALFLMKLANNEISIKELGRVT
ncbi:MAG: hydrolase [Chlamydiales bacterium]|nr:hydrolase [Chlamydiia bacterium]MCP5508330.1 hydrolase [Chlamydiales bacterium]